MTSREQAARSPGRSARIPEAVARWACDQGFEDLGRVRRHRTPSTIARARDGRVALLKWQVVDDPDRWTSELRHRTDLLRGAGCPVAAVLGAGTAATWACYLQEMLDITRSPSRRIGTTELVVEAVSRQRGLAPAGSLPSAGTTMERALGGHGTDRFAPDHVAAIDGGSELLERIWAIGRTMPPPPARDVCHFDLVPWNVVRTAGGGVAIVDWDHAGWGDAAFDLVTFDVWSPTRRRADRDRRPLVAACRSWAAPELLAGYAAVVVLWWLNDHLRGGRGKPGRLAMAHQALDRWLVPPA